MEYATEFFRQYIAYCHQDPLLFKNKRISLKDLKDYPSNHKAVFIAKEHIKDFLKRYEENNDEDARNHWDSFIFDPELLASASGIRTAVIIDEFQDMKFSIYDTSRNHFLEMRYAFNDICLMRFIKFVYEKDFS